MPLLPSTLQTILPPLGSQRDTAEPIVYARFVIPDTMRSWYATEGSPEGNDFVFFGFYTRPSKEWTWGEFRLSELESLKGPSGSLVVPRRELSAGAVDGCRPLQVAGS